MPESRRRLAFLKAPLWSLFAVCCLSSAAAASMRPPADAVASAHPLATEAGVAVLEAGGNAFDAAVAVTAALAVVEPYGSGIGGGGFWLLHRVSDGRDVMIDGREKAPLAATADMYLDNRGEVIPGASIDGPLAAGIPGVPAALEHIARYYGRLPLSISLGPAIVLAREGFPVDEVYRRMATFRLEALRASDRAAEQFLLNNEVPPLGHTIKQVDLADTLSRIAEGGADGFYRGDLAHRLVSAVRAAGGIWTEHDLLQYRVVERPPVSVTYRGHRIVSAALPSSGGILIAQMLKMLEVLGLPDVSGVDRVHLLVEVMRLAYADRAKYLGDSDFVPVPLARLLSSDYARLQAGRVDLTRAGPSQMPPGKRGEGRDTTHFSVLDRSGNRVAATLSINYPFGSGFVAGDTGVLLNDEMDDFSIKPGTANVYGLIGNSANAIAPGKRMLSSMSPTFVESAHRVVILGTPGGSRIITMVLHGILAAIDGHDAQQLVAAPRFHHQFLPNHIDAEPGAFDAVRREALEQRGHVIVERESPFGNMQVIVWDRRSDRVTAASDPRGIGQSVVLPVADR
jgi:gamma-glutamyltranspeptidase/glutathione hydrolase